jgi:hypothetical protein
LRPTNEQQCQGMKDGLEGWTDPSSTRGLNAPLEAAFVHPETVFRQSRWAFGSEAISYPYICNTFLHESTTKIIECAK